MKAERWEVIKRLCSAALELDAARREQFLAQACAGDPLLREEVESLLAQQRSAENFIESPALDAAARELARDPAADLSGSTLLHYRVEEKIGEGGMGVVYRARDTHLGRDVAIKLLPEAFSGDRERMARFEREAKLLASVNHPNIAAIHSIEKIEDTRFLVLELVEGETLAERIAKGRLPAEEALEICRQIAEALEAAHEKGIIHQDVKPANVKITPQEKVKVLDFGLAKPTLGGPVAVDRSHSPTASISSTHPGTILGTAPYMSPEQANGKPTDKRTDIWAFGCVLYECLTGRRAFAGETLTEITASILRNEPDWPSLPADTPPSVLAVLKRCLQKDSDLRLHDIADARIELREPFPESIGTPPSGRSWMLLWGGYALAALAVAGFVLTLTWRVTDQAAPTPVAVHTLLHPPAGYAFGEGVAVAPDGTKVAAVVLDASRTHKLWIHSLSPLTVAEQILPDTDGAVGPFWSPDSKFVGFFAGGKLKAISTTEPLSRPLATVTIPAGGDWNQEGAIIFCPDYRGALSWIPAQGESSRAATRMGQDDRGFHLWPRFVAAGRQFVFASRDRSDRPCVYLGSLDSQEGRVLVSDALAPDFAPPDYLLFLRAGSLMAQRFDFADARPLGDAAPVTIAGLVQQVVLGSKPTRIGVEARANYSVSRNGVLIYGAGSPGATRLMWRKRDGGQIGSPVEPGDYIQVYLSPNNTQASVTLLKDGEWSAWLLPLDTSILSRLTFDGNVLDPIWSPDSRTLAYQIYQEHKTAWKTLAVGERSPNLILDDGGINYPDDWSADGKWILGRRVKGERQSLILVAANGSAPPKELTAWTGVNVDQFKISPDGKWVAYNSDESGRYEVYLAQFPSMTGARPVSNAGGVQPLWRKDCNELFYITMDGWMMSVPLVIGATLKAEAPKPLFRSGVRVLDNINQYAVDSLGQKFLLIESELAKDPLEARVPLHVVSNWQLLLRR